MSEAGDTFIQNRREIIEVAESRALYPAEIKDLYELIDALEWQRAITKSLAEKHKIHVEALNFIVSHPNGTFENHPSHVAKQAVKK